MIFPKLKLEKVVQVEDKTRLDASLSFVTSNENITDVLIKPIASEGFMSVFNDGDRDKWFLDWAYSADEIITTTVKIVTDAGEKERDYNINILSEETDALLSDDDMLFPFEPNLYDYLPRGKNSFIYAHRAAQEKILNYLDAQRIWKKGGDRFDKFDISLAENKEDFESWSKFQTLLIIFESIQVSTGDVFQEKKLEYETEMRNSRARAALRLDVDADGVVDEVPYDIFSTRIIRR